MIEVQTCLILNIDGEISVHLENKNSFNKQETADNYSSLSANAKFWTWFENSLNVSKTDVYVISDDVSLEIEISNFSSNKTFFKLDVVENYLKGLLKADSVSSSFSDDNTKLEKIVCKFTDNDKDLFLLFPDSVEIDTSVSAKASENNSSISYEEKSSLKEKFENMLSKGEGFGK